ncbi:peptidase [Gardnerella vaginalis]|uniref:peptidase n=1 Tax=Gardnerella vaginalis TaxID=2702 RepID=UPI0039EFEBF0
MTTKSAKHANKTFGSAKDTAAKAVDTHKVAALSAGAAGVIAGAAIAFGATPAMAAETPASAPVNTNDPAKEQSVIANKKKAEGAEASKVEASNKNSVDAKPVVEAPQQTKVEAPTDSKESADAKQSVEPTVTTAAPIASTESTEENKTGKTESTKGENAKADGKSVDDKGVKQDTAENSTPAGNVAKSRKKRDLSAENHNQGEPVVGTDREANPEPSVSNQINISEDTKNSVPNMYAWGSSNNTYIKSGQSNTVTFNFAKPKDGYNISSIAIFPAQNNSMTTDKGRKAAEYYSGNPGLHQSYSGEYTFTPNTDGSAKLEMTPLFRDGNLNSGVAYAANRCIYVYGRKDGGDEVLLYKTNIARAATLIPPKTAGSIVLKYNEELTAQQIREKLQKAIDAPTEATGNKSIREQINTASTSKGVGTRGDNGAFVQTPDTAENKVIINDQRVYNPNDVTSFNTKTPKPGTTETTYITTVRTLKTHLITDTGYTSDDLPLTVARYDDRIEKPIVDDLSKVSDDVKTEIKRKLAHLNHVSQDQVTINDQGEVTINFAGVDAADAPKIALRDLVLKKLEEKDVTVPTGDKAVFVANPLGYSNAELDRIKTAIYEANKDNQELGLSKDNYKDQITLSYITGDLTGAGDANKGRSNGLQENNISVTIKTDKAVAKFTSDIIKDKLTRLPDIRTDYNVELVKNKLDGRDSDEGFSWSDDKHTTLIYRYDPTKAQAFTAPEIVKLIKATPKDQNTGLRPLTGGEVLDHEGANGKPTKSHMHYSIDKNGEPTTELTLGMMNGAYWIGDPQVANSDANMGDEESKVGQYTWDEEAGPVTVAAKQNKVFKTRLFVAPYALTYYRGVYTDPYKKNPNNTPKAINVIFVPQTNHKKSDLKKSVEDHKTTKVEGKDVPTESKYYNASDKKKEAYDEALKQANEALKLAGDTEDSKLPENLKALIDNATINLNKARAELDGDPTNKDDLKTSIEANGKAAEGQNPATGTQATNQFKNVSDPDFKTADGNADTKKNADAKKAKEDYDKALAEANKVKEDDNATQKAVDDAKAKLDAARKELDKYSTNKDELNNAIAQHGKVNTGDTTKQGDEKLKTADPSYQNSTKEERKAYDDAVTQANKIVADPNASQKEVNEAIKKLKEAKAKLDAKATDKSKLAAEEKQSFDNPNPNDETKQSVFYKNALNKRDNGANDQEKQAAKDAIDNYNNALRDARAILNNKKATQAQVDEAKKKLEEAENALHENYKSDDNDLTKAIANNVSGYLMPAYFNAFDQAQKDGADSQAAKDFKTYNDAYQKAKELSKKLKETEESKKPKQTEIDAAKTALEDARKVIDKYATDTSKISAALLHSLAITNSPAYKNASATDASEEAKKAAKAYDDALTELQKAFNDQMDKDKGDDGNEIPESVIPDKNIDMTNADALKKLQQHAKQQPLNRDVTRLLEKLNDAVKGLDKFATKTDDLIKSINEDATTHPSPAFKNASHPDYKQEDGTTADKTKNDAAKKAIDEYGDALNAAKDLLKNPAATQKQVNDALNTLNEKRKALDKYKTDTTKLTASVEKHGKDAEGTNPAVEGTKDSDAYRNASDPHFLNADGKPDTDKNKKAAEAKKAYDKALVEAHDLLKKADPENKTPLDAQPTQQQINDALTKLDDARTEIEKYTTDTTALNTEAEKSQADTEGASATGKFEDSPEFKNATYKQGVKPDTDPDVKQAKSDLETYKKALKNARELLAKKDSATLSDRPTQKQIDDALDALKQAKQAITDGYKTNVTALKDAKEFANGDFKKTPEYKNAFALKDDQNAKQDKKTEAQNAVNALDENTNDGALKKAKDILDKFDENGNPNTGGRIPTQAEVDAALKTLQDAMKTVTDGYKTNADKLKNEVGDKDQDGKLVTPPFEASVPYKNALAKQNSGDADATTKLNAYNEKLKAAQELINKVNNPDLNAKPEERPSQDDVDKALEALKKAKKDIDDAFATKATDLKDESAKSTADGATAVGENDFENTTEFKNADAKKGDEGKDNADVTAYKDALKKARTLLNKFDENGKPKSGEKDIPTQQEVDEALKNLKEIKDKILANYKTSPVELQKEVDKSKDGNDDTSTDVFENTPEFKNAQAKGDDAAKNALDDYNKKLTAARNLLANFDRTTGKPKTDLPAGTKVPTQQELDKALKDLQDAKQKITDGYKTNPSKLKTEADADGDFTKTPEYLNAQAKGDDASKKALDDYKKALEDANKVLASKDATQAQVDEALQKLKDAKSKLTDGYKTNKYDLRQEAGKDSDFTQSPEYQNAAGSSEAEAYKRALDEANAVLKNPNATQAEVDEALKKLQDAKQKLTDSHKTDKSDLNTEAGNDPDFRKSIPFIIGKAADLAEYQQALNDADSVLKDPNATQAQVDQALRRLRDAKQKLIDAYNRLINSGSGVGDNTGVGVNDSNNTSVNNVVDKGALQAEVDAALGDVSANASGVVADSNLVSEFNAALNYARLVLADANATQGQVDSALARLRAARAALRAGMLAARDSAGMNLKRGDVSGVNTGASSSVFAALAAVFAGLGVAGAASKRRKHSAR